MWRRKSVVCKSSQLETTLIVFIAFYESALVMRWRIDTYSQWRTRIHHQPTIPEKPGHDSSPVVCYRLSFRLRLLHHPTHEKKCFFFCSLFFCFFLKFKNQKVKMLKDRFDPRSYNTNPARIFSTAEGSKMSDTAIRFHLFHPFANNLKNDNV